MPGIGYCTPEDVRKALQEKDLSADLSTDIVESAIFGQSEWLRESTHRHWYEPDADTDADTGNDGLASAPLTHAEDVLSIPSSPHPAPSQGYRHADGIGQLRYPRPTSGRYTAVRLRRRDVRTISELLVLDATGSPTDWATEKTEGRGEDYYVQVDSADGLSTLYLDTASLPARQNFGDAVIATYDYGVEGLSNTVRRAIALRAGAQLVLDEDAQIGIPDSGQLVSLESKAQAMERQAKDLLSIHVTTPVS